MRFELMTSSLPRRRSTPELRGRKSQCQKNWSGRRDSNSRPSAWKADALPTELHPPISLPIVDFRLPITKTNQPQLFNRQSRLVGIGNRQFRLVQGVGFEPT